MAIKVICDHYNCSKEGSKIFLPNVGEYRYAVTAEDKSDYEDVSVDLCNEHACQFFSYILRNLKRIDWETLQVKCSILNEWLNKYTKVN